MTHRHLFLLLLPFWALLPGCKKAVTNTSAESRLIVLMSADTNRPYENAQVQTLMRLAFGQTGYNLKNHDAIGKSELQVSQLKEALAEKPFALIISPVDASALATQCSEAIQAGVLVIGLGENAAPLPCSTRLIVDQRELGRMAGEIATRALKRKAEDEGHPDVTGRLVELRGTDEDADSKARHEGFMSELGKLPGLVLVHDAPGQWKRQPAKDRITEALRLQSRFDVIYAHNDSMALGAAQALGEARPDMLIIGTDGFRGDEGGLSLVLSGELDATLHHPLLVELAWQIIQRRVAEPSYSPRPDFKLAPTLITPKNANEFHRNGTPPPPTL